MYILLIFSTLLFYSGKQEHKLPAPQETNLRIRIFQGKIISFESQNPHIRLTSSTFRMAGRSYKMGPKGIKVNISGKNPVKVGKNSYSGLTIFQVNGLFVRVITTVNMESYLAGVLAAEISSSWHAESIKAQAVASRTYAYYNYVRRKDKAYHMVSDTRSQVFKGDTVIHQKFIQALKETKGEILTYRREPIQAFFSANCGGETERVEEVWKGSEPLPYLVNVRSTYSSDDPRYEWQSEMTSASVQASLRSYLKKGERIKRIRISDKTRSGRAKEILIYTSMRSFNMKGSDFRLALGAKNIKSLMFSILPGKPGELRIKGRGFGHGVGLCQWSAKVMGEKGYRYQSILRKFYPRTRIL